MISDLRQAFRILLKSPGFSALVVAVLAVGIAANTAIFTIVDAVLLKPLPFADARRLVAIDTTVRNQPDNTSYPDFVDWRAQATTLDRLAAYTSAGATLTGTGDASSVASGIVTADLFAMLGVPPLRGRTFDPRDDAKGSERTVILSEGLWNRRYGRDESLVGRTITIDGEPFVVIGVMPASFEFPFDAEDPPGLWMPVNASRFAAQWAEQRSASFLKGLGHLRPGATIAAAQAELSGIAARLAKQYPRNQSRGVLVRPFHDVLVKDYRLGLIVLLCAVAAVLLIACANIANLLLARGSVRRREIAIRTALGATRGRIARQLLAESVVLASLGGVLGVVLSLWALDVLVRMSPLQIPRLHAVTIDRAALAFTALAAIVTGLLSGVLPALSLSRGDAADALKDGDRGGSAGGGARTRQVLVVAETAISLVLLAAAGLLVKSLVMLEHVDPGFVTERAAATELLLPGARYQSAAALRTFYARLRDELRSQPGVSASAISSTLPMSGSDINIGFTIEGRPVDPGTRLSAALFAISPDYFRTMGIPLVKGRAFTERDTENAPDVLIVSDAMAAKYFPDQDPIGEHLTIGYNNTGPREIVGIVRNVKQGTLAELSAPQIYSPFVQTPWPFIAGIVRTTAVPGAAAASLRAAVARVDPMQGVGEIRTLDQYVARSIATPKFTALLVSSFAGMALLLAAFGLFSVMAYSVAQRRREIGIRMALGAQASDVRSLVVSQALRLGGIGVAIGLFGALATTRVIDALLFGVSPNDPLTLAAVCGALFTALVGAAYFPARRATRVDPIVALRN